VRSEPVPTFSKEVAPTRLPEKMPELTNNVPTALMALLVPPVNVPSVALLENCVVPAPLKLESEIEASAYKAVPLLKTLVSGVESVRVLPVMARILVFGAILFALPPVKIIPGRRLAAPDTTI
jgi:hypothetical protein